MSENGAWLTPLQFQFYSGSSQAEWKSVIAFTSDVNAVKKRVRNFKTEIQRNNLKLHCYSCDCAICLDYDFILVKIKENFLLNLLNIKFDLLFSGWKCELFGKLLLAQETISFISE